MKSRHQLILIAVPAAAVLLAWYAGSRGSERPSVKDSRPAVRGQVVDGFRPVAGATVGFQGRRERVATDPLGSFALPAPASYARLVASKPGYYITACDWSPKDLARLQLDLHPVGEWRPYQWIAPDPDRAQPEQCANCHAEIYREWSQSGHAQSASNPHFMNLYEGTDWQGNENIGWSLLADNREASGVCYSCHVPSLEPDVTAIADLRKTSGVDRQGVHCDFCHKVADVSVEHVGLDHGRFAMRLVRPPPGPQLFFGPLDDDDRGRAVYSSLYRESRYCASCHEGTVLGTHAYGEYSEWLASSYAKRGVQCQDCHMAPTGHMTNLAPGYGGMERDPQTLASHGSARGNADALRSHLVLTIEGSSSAKGVEAVVQVQVRGVGHRMPTGYPDRALILWVRALDGSGKPADLLEGPVLPPVAGQGAAAEGGLAGEPGRMYAKILEGLDGRQPVPYWRPNRVKCDTRLLPDQTDRVTFRFRPVKPAQGAVTIVAQLLYRRFSKFLADQKGWPDNELVVVTKQTTLPGR